METASEVAKKLRDKLAESTVWEFESVLGSGMYGVAVLVRLRNPWEHGMPSRAVLKRAIGQLEGESLSKEIMFTKKLRGNAHIVQMFASSTNVFSYQGSAGLTIRPQVKSIFDTVNAAFENPYRSLFGNISGLGGPALLLEYLPNGSLNQLTKGMRAARPRPFLPNRLLWRIFACLVRACIGLIWPLEAGEGEQPQLEELRGEEPTDAVVHGDIHGENIMIGDLDPGVEEHTLVPQMKLIDLGLARAAANPNDAVNQNITAVSREMMNLINPYTLSTAFWAKYKGINTGAVLIVPQPKLKPKLKPKRGEYPDPNQPDQAEDPFAYLDEELRMLIVRALAYDSDQRPTLDEVVITTGRGLAKTVADYPGREDEESNEAITKIINDLIFNAG